MTAAKDRPRPGDLIGPLARPGVGARSWAGLLLVLLTAVGALGAMATGAALRQAQDLRERMADPVTVAVWASGLESADAAAGRASESLARVEGVKDVRLLEPDQADAGLARLMGVPAGHSDDVRLLVLDTTRDPGVVAGNAARALASAAVPARVDDHRWPGSPTLTAIAASVGAVLVIVALMAVLTGVISGWITRREISARAGQVDLLRLAGAGEGYIGRLFTARTLRLSLWAACLGAAAAAALAGLWVRVSPRLPAAPSLGLSRLDLAWPAPWILLVVLIAAATASLSARMALRRVR